MVTTSGVSPSELSTGVVSCRILRRGESRVVVEVSETTDRRQPGPSPDSPDVKGGHHGRGPGPSHRGRNAARRDYYTSYKVANMLVEFSTSIPRTQLRPGYGDGFLGAPLHTVVPPAKPSPREQGGRRGTSNTHPQHNSGGAPLV